jgi:hypothetical protein
MRGRALIRLGVFTLALTATAASRQPPARAATLWTAPRTSWGDPDFSGLWNYATMTPLERAQAFAGKDVLTEGEAAAYEKQTTDRQAATNNTAGPDWWDEGTRHLTDRRTALIVDPANGRVPPLTPEAQKRAAARTAANRARGPADGPEDLGLNVRCLVWSTAGPPMLPGVYNNNVQFIQTRDHMVIVNEMIHDARIVPMDGRPHGSARSWMGRWDGQTLVVDTINFSEKAAFRGSGESLHLVERFTRVSDGTIRYEFTVEDPATWTRPWTAMVPMTKIDGTMLEYACHEGNYRSMEGILRAARVQDPRH